MLSRRLFALSSLAWAAGCAAAAVPPPRAAPAEPRAAAPVSLAQRIRREGWITRFWEQLTPAQHRRILARMRRGEAPLARSATEAAPVWDALGLPDRDALVFGPGLSRPPEAAAAPVLASD